MRHNKHRHQLGVKKEHREAIMASLATALFSHDRIQTTLGRAKALRPFAEKVITLAKKAAVSEDSAQKLHYYRQAIAQVRDETAVHELFSKKVEKFLKREGGYTRIYKLVPRIGDAADMALIELIEADDKGYKKPAKKTAKKATKKTAKKATKKALEAEVESETEVEAKEVEAPVAAEETSKE